MKRWIATLAGGWIGGILGKKLGNKLKDDAPYIPIGAAMGAFAAYKITG